VVTNTLKHVSASHSKWPQHVNEACMSQGQRGGKNKTLRPKSAEGLRKSCEKLYQLFSSFLRGASRPKSPRSAAASGSTINDTPAGPLSTYFCFDFTIYWSKMQPGSRGLCGAGPRRRLVQNCPFGPFSPSKPFAI